jgi:Ricin-type beta-trefoil lectin domain-like/F5/8 type C domain
MSSSIMYNTLGGWNFNRAGYSRMMIVGADSQTLYQITNRNFGMKSKISFSSLLLGVHPNQAYKLYTPEGKVLTVGESDNASSVVLQDDQEKSNQHFEFIPSGKNYFKIRNLASGKLLTLSNKKNVVQQVDKGEENQQWKLKQTDTGEYQLFSRQSDIPLSLDNGTNKQDLWAITYTNRTPRAAIQNMMEEPVMKASGGNEFVGLEWQKSFNAATYNIKRSLKKNGPYDTIASGLTLSSYIDKSVKNGMKYYYIVEAVSKNSKTVDSQAAYAIPSNDIVKLNGAIMGTDGAHNSNHLNTKDKAMDGDLGTYFNGAAPDNNWVGIEMKSPHQITMIRYAPRATWPGGWLMKGGIFQGANKPDFSDAVNLGTIKQDPENDGVTYANMVVTNTDSFKYVRYVAPDGIGAFAQVSELEFYGPKGENNTPPVVASPYDVTASPGKDGIFVNWSNTTTAKEYTLKRATKKGGPYEVIANGLKGPVYEDKSIKDGQTYYYVVSATNGAASKDSVEVSATASSAVEKVTGKIIGITDRSNNDSGMTKEKVFDGDLNTYFDSPYPMWYQSQFNWVGLDLGSPHTITSIKYAPISGDRGWMMIGGLIQGANRPDFSDAVDLATITKAPAEGELTPRPVHESKSFRYVRYYAPQWFDTHGNISELEFFGYMPK